MNLPSRVVLCEVGLRDGLQSEHKPLPLQQKIALAKDVIAAGFPVVELGSFVNPKAVPQMADTDALFEELGDMAGAVELRALAANRRGVETRRSMRLQKNQAQRFRESYAQYEKSELHAEAERCAVCRLRKRGQRRRHFTLGFDFHAVWLAVGRKNQHRRRAGSCGSVSDDRRRRGVVFRYVGCRRANPGQRALQPRPKRVSKRVDMAAFSQYARACHGKHPGGNGGRLSHFDTSFAGLGRLSVCAGRRRKRGFGRRCAYACEKCRWKRTSTGTHASKSGRRPRHTLATAQAISST